MLMDEPTTAEVGVSLTNFTTLSYKILEIIMSIAYSASSSVSAFACNFLSALILCLALYIRLFSIVR